MQVAFPFDSSLSLIFQLLDYNCRLVGGCVRDFILFNKLVDDIDIATPFLPDEVIARLGSRFSVVPTGLAHGTVTVFLGDKKYEITTLRKDTLTDGRHATVVFNSSYEEDAKRRDFTINALYCDYDGNIYDYFSGLEDLKLKLVRFIGDPKLRIEEDFLRILRFFRFSFRFSSMHEESLVACYSLKDGLKKISLERLTQEWFLIISHSSFFSFFTYFFPIMDILNLSHSTLDMRFKEASSLAITAVCLLENSRLSLSNSQKKYINNLKKSVLASQTDANFIFNKFGAAFFKDVSIIHNIDFSAVDVPPFPVSGQDLLNLGLSGQKIGTVLRSLEYEWFANFGMLTKDDLLSRIDEK